MSMKISEVLGENGLFKEKLPGFKSRPQQIELAEKISQVIEDQSVLIAEAGTGTGKTFAYLLPALLSGKKIIVSTGTKTLQDQLFSKDIPKLLELLSIKPKVRLLKGRSNYLCLHRYHKAAVMPVSRFPENKPLFKYLKNWIHNSIRGEVSEFINQVENRMLLMNITSNPENCLGSECDHYNDCFVYKARRKALEADLLVINHHLLFADMAIKQGGFGELLPKTDVIVLDESHQIPEIAGRFFSHLFSSRQCTDILNDLLTEAGEVDAAFAAISEPHEQMKRSLRDTLLVMSQMPERESSKRLFQTEIVIEAFDLLLHQMNLLITALEPLVVQSTGLQNCYVRLDALKMMLEDMMQQKESNYIYWFEAREKYFALHKSPLEIADPLSEFRAPLETSWVLTSATLTVNHSFAHFQSQTGFDPAETLLLDSPFDYPKQALMLLPKTLPEPNDFEFNRAMFDYVTPIINQAKGGVFFLFTSHRSLQMAAYHFRDQVDRPLFVQGEGDRNQMLEDFRASGNGLLLGAASFWEGVDVSGASLSCVIIDKLPFAHPSEPVLKAKIEHINKNGGKAFFDYQIPKAIISLKQGAGRLIRGEDDRGVLVICDRRITSKGYGSTFLNSLPDMKISHERQEALDFLSALK
ncbi:ATP-dependent DNA helicase [Marinicella litoralis]|uniref:DNA 5'-3' helicase n=2 Tax=Marinicella litoralis TaxID=644220 RepID=A0A4R6XUS9_9GAMM|nr:ATP-dependent DNA helicase [Marinicella litoralis]TDR23765.1 ATP-dependent DNA helicase DinG [Marinicella litoralis]